MLNSFNVLLVLVSSVQSFQVKLVEGAIDFEDTSNCTWSGWSSCSLYSETRCARTRSFDLLPIDNQTLPLDGKEMCRGQAGRVDSADCDDGLCPTWNIGNWTDCSGTCSMQLPPWAGYQTRPVACIDSSGLLYRKEVCKKVWGLGTVPLEEQTCECSHRVPPYDPYASRYGPVTI